MEKPYFLTTEVFEFFSKMATNEKELRGFVEMPIKSLLDLGVFDTPEILINSLFALETGEEVIITEDSILGIRALSLVPLMPLYSRNPTQKEFVILPYEQFLENFRNSNEFDAVG